MVLMGSLKPPLLGVLAAHRHSCVCTHTGMHIMSSLLEIRRGLFTAVLGGVWGTQEPPFHTFLPSAPTGLHPPAGFRCQPGAIKNILEDFWRLVWERQVHMVVMLTMGMEN